MTPPSSSSPSTEFDHKASTTTSPSESIEDIQTILTTASRSVPKLSDEPNVQKKEYLHSLEEETSKIQLTDQTNLLPFRQIIIVYIALSSCVVVTALDSVIVATSLSTIANSFRAGSVISWVPSAYLLTSTAFQPLYGRFSDIFGRKSAMCLAMGLYMLGNLISGFTKGSIVQVIICRGVAGAGGGGIVGMMQIIVSDIITLRERGKYHGMIGAVVALGYTIGPIVGGLLAQKVSWRWCFWVTLPLSLVSSAVVVLVLPVKPVAGDIRKKLLLIDYVGSLLTLIGCALIMLPLIWGGVTFPWTHPVTLSLLFSGALVVLLFCLYEWKCAKLPIVPMYIFKHSTVSGVYICMFANGFVFFSSLYYIPQFFQAGLGYSPIRAGLFLIPLLVGQTAFSWVAGMLVSYTGRYRTIVYTGFAFIAISCGFISTITHNTSKATMVILMLLSGCGSGLTLATTTVAVQASVERKDMSVVTAFRNFVRSLGAAFSLSVASSVVNNSLLASMIEISLSPSTITTILNDPSILARAASIGLPDEQALHVLEHGYEAGFKTFFIINASLGVMATIVSATMVKHKELSRDDDEKLKNEAKAGLKKQEGNQDTEAGVQSSELVVKRDG
ncbi:major facilitator superfamily domain-containing protein [Lentinula edodes]|uniref:Major facilitator superfamily domain-containing protein n=1 Tax=Lentinula lateritia TaxID=40482 RepID=A0A9W9A609_9AGAR|nr:major facilitator superfamily domain-containing protein [Lentinula edodes]